jgi:hypothetical protein
MHLRKLYTLLNLLISSNNIGPEGAKSTINIIFSSWLLDNNKPGFFDLDVAANLSIYLHASNAKLPLIPVTCNELKDGASAKE